MKSNTPTLERESAARLQREREFHDRQAAERAQSLRADEYRFADESFLAHESWIAPAFGALGDVRGLNVLDLGCGHGMASVVLARRGARVTACDLSLGYLREAQQRARANDVNIRLVACDAERLPFAGGAFDRVWGNAILHHLDLSVAARELHRVLAPGGVAVFCEPWAGNPLLNWARQRLHYPGKQRTPDESPLARHDLELLRSTFPNLHVRGCQLLSMLGRVWKQPRFLSGLERVDEILLRAAPICQHYCRYVIIIAKK